MKIATWNINGVKARLETALTWLREATPDIACLQEIKSVDDGFPAAAFEDLGYNVAVHGQKSFNGVAILSRQRFDEVSRGLPGDTGDEQARYIEATISVAGTVVRVASIYLPNGNPIGTEKFTYKLDWMRRLEAHAADLPAAGGAHRPVRRLQRHPRARRRQDARGLDQRRLFQPESRAAFRRLVNLGFTDAIRACAPGETSITFWDYQAGAWQKNEGIRIDHLMLSPLAADRLAAAGIDKHTRGWEKPSDHVPVWIELEV